ncbi:putative secreted protein [Catenulispora acidiphila DSM 44928]|uniref:Putative secreted protein n=1 Tax=Catenulispora acidiphila (strain DSM 44928 / JCM 14897 / NBRC 102108 / NRRL B-24433 / ID139908) TaxID=479433 RepID=C7Q7T7_CATAD|nr:hypothetical protein [Catenulispora acidiphila]ACU72280.1 putative secreted protein [Catenulispora acidiphila DSM 44928]
MIIGVVVAIIVIAGILIAGAVEYDRRRKRAAYGPEYDKLVEQEGSPRAADRELSRRRRAYANLELRPLGGEERARYSEEWRAVQGAFVDDPAAALNDAEALVVRLARFRGYPGNDSETLLELLSIPHTGAVTGYREATQVRQTAEQDPQNSSTEDMRQAFQKYAALFDNMLDEAGTGEVPQRSQSSDSRETSSMEVGR